jgi:DNA-binding transcriptional LysR family regulator
MIEPLTLDQLRVLVAVAEAGSFSAAARQLRRVQSAVSQYIQALENTLQLQLFDRSGKWPKLTEAGQAVVSDARQLLRGAQALRSRAGSMVDGLEPALSLAIDPLFPSDMLIDALHAVEGAFPGLPLTLFTEPFGGSEHRLRNRTAHLAIYSVETPGSADLDAEFLTDVELFPVVSAGHPLAERGSRLSRDDLAEYVQLVLTEGVPEGRSRGILSDRIWRFADVHTRQIFLLGGFGWCSAPRHLVEPQIIEGSLVRLNIKEQPGFTVPLHLVHLQDAPPRRAARFLIEQVRLQFAKTLIAQAEAFG